MKAASRLCGFSLLMLVLGACASSDKSGAALRKEGYDAILRNIKPGMYRRQLYALLPPARTPEAHPPSYWHSLPIAYTEHREKHELDDECFLMVRYQLKDGSEYAKAAAKQQYRSPRPKSPSSKPIGNQPVTPDSIDGLLKGIPVREIDPFKPGPMPSRENPDDIITSISQTRLTTDPEVFMDFGLTCYPTQDGMRHGRGPSH